MKIFRKLCLAAAVWLGFTAFARDRHTRTVYVFSATHFDTTFTGPPPFSYARNYRILDALLKLAKEQSDLRFVIENQYVLQDYLRSHPEAREPLRTAIGIGRIELAAQWCSMLQNPFTGEDLLRNVEMASQFAQRNFGFTPTVQSLSDVPGQTSQTPQILSRSGVRGVIFTRAGPSDAHLFTWQGLDGSRTRAVTLPNGYAGGYLMGLADSLEAMEGSRLATWELSDISPEIMTNRIDQAAGFEGLLRATHPAGIDRALVEVAWDNIMPPRNLAANIDDWNFSHPEGPKLIPALPGTFFEHDWPSDTPLKSGDIPSVWANGAWSLFGGYRRHIRTTHTLLRAEKWGAIASALLGWKYPAETMRQAWGEHLITLDHESHDLWPQVREAEILAEKVSEDARDALASHVRIPQPMDIGVVVFNALNWKRSGIVTTDVWLVGDPFAFFTRPWHKLSLVDAGGKAVPFEVVSTRSSIVRTIRIRFRAEDVPPLGWKTWFLRPSDEDQAKKFPPAQESSGEVSLDNGAVEAVFDRSGRFRFHDRATNASTVLTYYHQPQSLDAAPGFFRNKDSGTPVMASWTKVVQGTNLAGPWMEADGMVAGARLRVGVQLEAGGLIRISETVNPAAGATLRLIRKTDFAGEGRFVYGVPFGAQTLDKTMPAAGPVKAGSFDQLSRAEWMKTREFDGWAAWQNGASETVVASEARGGRFDGHALTVVLLDSSNGAGPQDSADPAPGEFVTRIAISFSGRLGNGPRAGWEFSNPLEPTITVSPLSGVLPSTFAASDDNPDAMVTALKMADDGRGLAMRAVAMDRAAQMPRVLAASGWIPYPANLIEQASPQASAILKPWEIRTVRLRKPRPVKYPPAGPRKILHPLLEPAP